jgi:hypothetical protein
MTTANVVEGLFETARLAVLAIEQGRQIRRRRR